MKFRLFNELNFDPGYLIVKFFASKKPLTFLFKNLVSALSNQQTSYTIQEVKTKIFNS